MRIVYLHQYFTTTSSPGGTRSYEMARRLVSYGHEVHLLTSDRVGRSSKRWTVTNEGGITVHWLPVPYSNAMSYGRRIRAFFRFALSAAFRAAAIPADLIFATSTPLTIALPAVYAAKRRNIPMVFEVRDLWPDGPIAVGALRNPWLIGLARWLERFAYRHASRIVALSPGMKEGIVRHGYPADQVCVIPNGADLDLFAVPRARGQEFRARHAWLQDRPLVVYTGTLGHVNGVSYLVELAAAVEKDRPDICFLVIGEGNEEDQVRALAAARGVLDKNFFMMKPVAKRAIPSILSAADLAISLVIDRPVLWTNSANKFFDALAAGTPIAINHEGWQADLIRETGAGLVLSARDIHMAAVRLTSFLLDQDRLGRAGGAAKQLASERFARDQLARLLEEELRRAVESREALGRATES